MTENYRVVRDAIKTRKQIHAVYNGKYREMSPHAIGIGKDGVTPMALFYQFNSPLGEDDWRCMKVADLTEVVAVEGAFYTRNKHTRPQTCIKVLDVEIDYK